MNLEEFYNLIKASAIPFKYRLWEKNEVPEPPYGVYFSTGTKSFIADGGIYDTTTLIAVELYTIKKDASTEEKLEKVFADAGLIWSKAEVYLTDEKMYETIYKLEV